MIVTAFVSANNGNAGKPGAAQRQVRLNHVKGPAPTPAVPAQPATATSPAVPAQPAAQAPGPNDALFDNPNQGDISITFNGINAATKGFFEEGVEYVVSIEKAQVQQP